MRRTLRQTATVLLLLLRWGHVALVGALRQAPPSLSSVSAGTSLDVQFPEQVGEQLYMRRSDTISGRSFGVRYSATLDPSQTVVSINFVLEEGEGKQLEILANCSDGSVVVDGHDSVLAAGDLHSLQQLDSSFQTMEAPPDRCSVRRLLLQATSLVAVAPLYTKLGRKQPKPQITCLKKLDSAMAAWTDKVGMHEENITVGVAENRRYDCMGRCGAGCLMKSLIKPFVQQHWTQDCLNHDMCSYRNNSTMGAMDPNCGDEFVSASDDYLWATWCAGSGL